MEEGKAVYNINIGRGQRVGAGERSLQTRRGRAAMPIGRILWIEMAAFPGPPCCEQSV